jgi:hypothetical protein
VAEVLSADWQIWLAEELLQGTPTNDLVAAMVRAQVTEEAARRTIDSLAHSPLLIAARRSLLPAQRLLEHRRSAASKAAIPRIDFPGVSAFFDDYYAQHRPVILKGFAAAWPALNWTPKNLAKQYGSTEVVVCTGRTGDPRADAHFDTLSRSMTLAQYIDLLLAQSPTNDLYMIARNGNLQRPELAPMLDDLRYPEGMMRNGMLSACLWLGPEGTKTVLHHDRNNIIFCQLYGTKTIDMIDPATPELLPFHGQIYAPVELREFVANSVKLTPGDALFIPVGWWHRVRAETISISVSSADFSIANQDVF